MATIIRVGGVPVSDYEPTEITTMEHSSGIYSYKLTAPSDGTYLLTSVFSGYAGSGSVSLGTGVTEIVRHSCSSKYGGKGGVTVVARFKAGQTATVAAACSGDDPDNSILSYGIWRLSD